MTEVLLLGGPYDGKSMWFDGPPPPSIRLALPPKLSVAIGPTPPEIVDLEVAVYTVLPMCDANGRPRVWVGIIRQEEKHGP